jgi:hypothetical protein
MQKMVCQQAQPPQPCSAVPRASGCGGGNGGGENGGGENGGGGDGDGSGAAVDVWPVRQKLHRKKDTGPPHEDGSPADRRSQSVPLRSLWPSKF